MSCFESRTVTNRVGTGADSVSRTHSSTSVRDIGHLPVEGDRSSSRGSACIMASGPPVAVHVVPILCHPALQQGQLVRLVLRVAHSHCVSVSLSMAMILEARGACFFFPGSAWLLNIGIAPHSTFPFGDTLGLNVPRLGVSTGSTEGSP